MNNLYIHSETIHNFNAAEEIVPLLLKYLKVNSVVDIGCGLGTWLKIFADNGIIEILGIDGVDLDEAVLKISKSNFKFSNFTQPLVLDKKYDLALCLEVVEHLPENAADIIVASLVNASDVILFSAALPGQGGQNHLNEQWPTYWQQKFTEYGYNFYDTVRPQIWNNEKIEYWYRQNIFLVAKKNMFEMMPIEHNQMINVVHPATFTKTNEHLALLNSKQNIYEGISFKKFAKYTILKKFKSIFS